MDRGVSPGLRSELKVLPTPVYDKLLSFALLLEEYGPSLGRPTVDTLNGSRHPNMKELRVGQAQEPVAVAVACGGRVCL